MKPVSPAASVPDVLVALPELQRVIGPICAIAALSGFGNEVFRVDGDRGSFILRIERPSLKGRVDRHLEAAYARRAEALGFGPQVLFADPARGVMLLRAVPDARPLGAGDAADPAEAAQLGALLRRLHTDVTLSGARFDPAAWLAARRPALMAAGLLDGDALAVARAVEDLARQEGGAAGPAVPSHCDLVPQNVLLSQGRLWLIDFEYAGRADPAWDLAYAGLEAAYGGAARMALLAGYCAGDLAAAARLAPRVARMRPVCDVVSAFWALEQMAAGNPAADFASYADTRLARAAGAL
ncbi:choline/ethanolamine kinase family protein [Pannonibacter tanglangensis]|uniref:Phosphotransferase n=1 Tax=Pannonibacter tanglangensis TaxID=2750084 RepID=A0ABW9ZFH1_9HYPH|nr:choline/ethanolamine kinase family protein [Pannonibacter sp. XCT-34]NBN63423.1 phosphotransferase [Pannonibacter sp. XCT-34]